MIFLYILECMLMGLISLHGGTNRVMWTTGEKQSWTDVLVSVISWFVVVSIYIGIRVLIKRKQAKKIKKMKPLCDEIITDHLGNINSVINPKLKMKKKIITILMIIVGIIIITIMGLMVFSASDSHFAKYGPYELMFFFLILLILSALKIINANKKSN